MTSGSVHNRLDVNDLSVRHSLVIEGTGMSPPKMRSAKRILGSLAAHWDNSLLSIHLIAGYTG
jgi:hypothetical protein